MSAICNCKNATIAGSKGEEYCKDCGAWWVTKYGSIEPDGVSPKVKVDIFGNSTTAMRAKKVTLPKNTERRLNPKKNKSARRRRS